MNENNILPSIKFEIENTLEGEWKLIKIRKLSKLQKEYRNFIKKLILFRFSFNFLHLILLFQNIVKIKRDINWKIESSNDDTDLNNVNTGNNYKYKWYISFIPIENKDKISQLMINNNDDHTFNLKKIFLN